MLNLEMIIKEVEKILRQAGQRSISCPAGGECRTGGFLHIFMKKSIGNHMDRF